MNKIGKIKQVEKSAIQLLQDTPFYEDFPWKIRGEWSL